MQILTSKGLSAYRACAYMPIYCQGSPLAPTQYGDPNNSELLGVVIPKMRNISR